MVLHNAAPLHHASQYIDKKRKKERECERETEKKSYKIVSHLRINALQKARDSVFNVLNKYKSDDHIMEAFRRLENT